MSTRAVDVPSIAREELDALLIKTTPSRSYTGLFLGVLCAIAAASGGYALAQSPYAPQLARTQSVVSRSTFDSLTKYVLAREQSTNALLSQIQNDVAALHQTNYALVAEGVRPYLPAQHTVLQQTDIDAVLEAVSDRLELPHLIDSLHTVTKSMRERAANVETRLNLLSARVGTLPAVLFSTTNTADDGGCIPVRLYTHDARKQEYANGKNSLLCSQVQP